MPFLHVLKECWGADFSPSQTTSGVCALKSWLEALVLTLTAVLRAHIYYGVPGFYSSTSWLRFLIQRFSED